MGEPVYVKRTYNVFLDERGRPPLPFCSTSLSPSFVISRPVGFSVLDEYGTMSFTSVPNRDNRSGTSYNLYVLESGEGSR